MIFQNRTEAGHLLAKRLTMYAGRKNVIVLGVPRGGVSVAFEVATAIKAPLDVFLSRKLGVPGQEELAFGAVASGGVQVLDHDIIEAVGLSETEINQITKSVQRELDRRQRVYRGTSTWPERRYCSSMTASQRGPACVRQFERCVKPDRPELWSLFP